MTEHPWKPVPYNCPSKYTRGNTDRAKRCPKCGVVHRKGRCPRHPNHQQNRREHKLVQCSLKFVKNSACLKLRQAHCLFKRVFGKFCHDGGIYVIFDSAESRVDQGATGFGVGLAVALQTYSEKPEQNSAIIGFVADLFVNGIQQSYL